MRGDFGHPSPRPFRSEVGASLSPVSVVTVLGSQELAADELRRQREEAGLSTYELAGLLDVSPGLVQHWETGRKRVPRGRLSELRRVLATRAPVDVPAMPGHELRALRERAQLSQSDVARLLGVKQPAVAGWEAGEVPEARRAVLREALAAEAPAAALMRALRKRAGWKQAELAERVGCRQTEISAWERGEQPIPPERWPAIHEALAAAERDVRPPQRPLDGNEMRAGREHQGLSQVQFAAAIGVSRSTVAHWEKGLKPVPEERWEPIRQFFGTTEPPPSTQPRDRVAEALALVVPAIAAEPGRQRSEVIASVDAPEPHTREAVKRALAEDLAHERRVPRRRADGLVRAMVGLFPGPAPAELPPVDLAVLVVPEAVAAIAAAPGRTRRQVAEALPHDRRLGERAIARALRERRVHERGVIVRDSRGAHTPMVLWPGATPPAAQPIDGTVLRRLRERLVIGQSELARRLGVGAGMLRGWEAEQVPPAWREAVAGELRQVAAAAEARDAELRQRIVDVVRERPGLPRWGELPGHLRHIERPLLARLLDELVAAGELHERVVHRGRGGVGLFAGPPPPEWEPGPEISADELRTMREWAGLSQAELAQRLGAGVATVNAWERGAKPVPGYRRGQVRQALAERKPPEPAPVAAEMLLAERDRTGMTQAELADRLGVSQVTISAWERGARPVPAELRDRVREMLAAAPTAPRVSRAELRRWQEASGCSSEELAARLGVVGQTVGEWRQRGVARDRAAEVRALIDGAAPTQGSLFAG